MRASITGSSTGRSARGSPAAAQPHSEAPGDMRRQPAGGCSEHPVHGDLRTLPAERPGRHLQGIGEAEERAEWKPGKAAGWKYSRPRHRDHPPPAAAGSPARIPCSAVKLIGTPEWVRAGPAGGQVGGRHHLRPEVAVTRARGSATVCSSRAASNGRRGCRRWRRQSGPARCPLVESAERPTARPQAGAELGIGGPRRGDSVDGEPDVRPGGERSPASSPMPAQ